MGGHVGHICRLVSSLALQAPGLHRLSCSIASDCKIDWIPHIDDLRFGWHALWTNIGEHGHKLGMTNFSTPEKLRSEKFKFSNPRCFPELHFDTLHCTKIIVANDPSMFYLYIDN